MENLVGKKIKEAMAVRGMKQSDIVKATGINKGALSSYINGSYLPKQNNLFKIATALKVTPAWLMGYDSPMDSEELINILKSKENDYLVFTKEQYLKKDNCLFAANANLGFLNKLLKEKYISKEVWFNERKKILDNLLNSDLISEEEYNEKIKDNN